MDIEECRLAVLYYFKDSIGHPPLDGNDWELVREYTEFVLSGSAPSNTRAGLASSRRDAN